MRSKFAAFYICLMIPGIVLAGSQAPDGLQVVCGNPSNLKSVPGYKDEVAQMLQQRFPGAVVKCTSCYRSPQHQAATCQKICGNPNGCPGRCARPGGSQHQRQHIAVCDLAGVRGDQSSSCRALRQLCDERFGGKCGIGAYPGGGYHFGAGDNHFSAWNKCGFLSNEASRARALDRRTAEAAQSVANLSKKSNDEDLYHRQLQMEKLKQQQQSPTKPKTPAPPPAPENGFWP